MIRLGKLEIKSGVIQSPMAGCTDLAYRLLSREYGMEICFLEMVSSEALVRDHADTGELMKTVEKDKPLGAQIVGCRPEAMAESAKRIEGMGYDWLDINFGCPVPKIFGNGAGSAMLNKPAEAKDIFRAVRHAAKNIPVTVKMRLGIKDASGKEASEIAKIAESEGLDGVTVHGRTREQGYSGTADYEAIRRVKDAVQIPVIGNGDILNGKDALRMKEIAGVDGVMIGRGGLGNPWIFKEVSEALHGREIHSDPSIEQKRKALLRHLDLELEHRDEKTAVLHMRRIACWYFKNVPGANDFRGKVTQCKTASEIRTIIQNFGYATS